MELPDDGFGERAKELVVRSSRREEAPLSSAPGGNQSLLTSAATKQRPNPLLLAAFQTSTPTNKADIARLYGELLKRVYEDSKKPADSSASTQPTDAERELLTLLTSK